MPQNAMEKKKRNMQNIASAFNHSNSRGFNIEFYSTIDGPEDLEAFPIVSDTLR